MTPMQLSEAFELRADEPSLVAEPPIPTVERLVLRDGRVLLIVEEKGGAELSVTDYGVLDEGLYFDVAQRYWPLLDQWLDMEADAIPYADLVAAAHHIAMDERPTVTR